MKTLDLLSMVSSISIHSFIQSLVHSFNKYFLDLVLGFNHEQNRCGLCSHKVYSVMGGRHKINNHIHKSPIIKCDTRHERVIQRAMGGIKGGTGPSPR